MGDIYIYDYDIFIDKCDLCYIRGIRGGYIKFLYITVKNTFSININIIDYDNVLRYNNSKYIK